MKKAFSAYIHIPYCKRKCPYCDFNIHVARPLPEDRYVAALLGELEARSTDRHWIGRPVQTMYFGGGTPSILRSTSIGRIIRAVQAFFPLLTGGEIGLEANPEGLSAPYLTELKSAGVNRLSLGVQSFAPTFLKLLGRRHTPEEAKGAAAAAKEAGLDNLNIDIIFGIPGQTLLDFERDVDEALALGPMHLSVYGLTVEEGTPLLRNIIDGKYQLPHEDTLASMMEHASEKLRREGFVHYEISNFARPGYQSQHNLAYWNGDDYLGIGAGAHSFLRTPASEEGHWGRRWGNYVEPERYMALVEKGATASSWEERLSGDESRFEFLFLGLRKLHGVSLEEYQRLFHRSILSDYEAQIAELSSHGLVSVTGGMIRLTAKGVLVADSVIGIFA